MVKLQLSRLLGDRKWKQAELVRQTGIRANTISDMYHGIAERVSLEHLDRICEALDCPLNELITRVPGKMRKTGENLIVEDHAKRKNRLDT